MNIITVIDYDCGNLFSVSRAIEKAGARVNLTRDADIIANAERVILPGVGAFGAARKALDVCGLIDPIRRFAATGRPFLGICLGMQLLFDSSEEFGAHKGLGLIQGSVRAIPRQRDDGGIRRIPNIGWCPINQPSAARWQGSILDRSTDAKYMYFVHSFVGVPSDRKDILATVEYDGAELCAAVSRDNVTGLQFHPEKSGADGLALIETFVNGG